MDDMLRSYNPADGKLIDQIPKTPLDTIPYMIRESKEAQLKWAALSFDERIGFIEKAAEKVGLHLPEIAELLGREMGKNLKSAIGEVKGCLKARRTAEYVKEGLKPQVRSKPGIETVIEYLPLGVCAIISPWNYPVSMAHWMIIPALTAGNSVILKPSEETPLVSQAYVDALNEVLPKNVLQIVQGGIEHGSALVNSPDIAFIGFTGSKETGKKIMSSASKTLKRLILELGGKDPLIVLNDADIDTTARFAIINSIENSGQMCIATERIFVDERIADEFVQKLADYIKDYKIGTFDDPDAFVGPIINEKQRQLILDHIDDAIAKGAKLIYGGKDHPEHFVIPTILDGITDDMRIAKEETFGPVVCVTRYNDLDKAIESANSTEYGLGASVFGHQYVQETADRLNVGMIGINTVIGGIGDVPWVGAKQSGFGYHGSPEGHKQFTQTRLKTRVF